MTSLFLARHRLLFVLLGGLGIATALAMDLPANQKLGRRWHPFGLFFRCRLRLVNRPARFHDIP